MKTALVMRFVSLLSAACCGLAAAQTAGAPVVGAQAAEAAPPSFTRDVIPILTRYGCSAGSCHGKLAGQNGFRLSLRGFAPEQDLESITREGRGRRIHLAAAEQSLLMKKALGELPHGGGRRFEPDSRAAQTLLAWIRDGAPGPLANEPQLARLEVSPAERTLKLGELQQLTATANYSDGSRRDVTWLTQFAPADEAVLSVTPDGKVTAVRPGEGVIRASFAGHVEIATFTMPREGQVDAAAYAERRNAIDGPVFDKLSALKIEPAPPCDDATFLRRAMLDAIGTLPTPDEVRAFLADERTDRRQRLIEDLLSRPEFVDFWALQLGDLLQNRKERDHDVRGAKGVRKFHHWLRQQLLAERSWREIASDVLLASGSTDVSPAVGYFVVTVGEKQAEHSEVVDSVAQAFLGVRIGCARCHNHPLEKYTQDDYYHFAAYFSRLVLDRKPPAEGATSLIVASQHEWNLRREQNQKREEIARIQADAALPAEQKQTKVAECEQRIADLAAQIDQAAKGAVETRQPRTGKMLPPQPLDRRALPIPPGGDPRAALASWMTDPANEQFTGAMVNRLWKHFLGVGLVEPVDDLRATNPPSNRELWQLLCREFRDSDFNLKHVMRLILNSRTYQLSSSTNTSNLHDNRFYSHYYARRLPAEVLLDALCQVSGQSESFAGYPQGVRAIQAPDPAADSYFLTIFGRSARTTACACERESAVTLPQLLHLQNSDALQQKLKSPDGRFAQLLKAQPDDEMLLEELFLAALSRLPTQTERTNVAALLADAPREEAYLDLLWALVNSKEFAFNH